MQLGFLHFTSAEEGSSERNFDALICSLEEPVSPFSTEETSGNVPANFGT